MSIVRSRKMPSLCLTIVANLSVLLLATPIALQAYGTAVGAESVLASQYAEFTKDLSVEYDRIFSTSQNANVLGDYVAEQYRKLFLGYQNQATIERLPADGLHELYNATIQVVFFNIENPRYRSYLQLDYTILKRRHLATTKDVTEFFDILVSARLFDRARRFAQQYPEAHLPQLPVVKQAENLTPGLPTELAVSVTKRELVRQSVDIGKEAKVVLIVNPLCHFAQHGIQAINTDPKLRAIFEKDTVWLGPAGNSLFFDAYQHWNRQHPKEQIGIAYLPSEWPMINSWGLPTFYFFKNGVLVEKLIGWWTTVPPGKVGYGSVATIKMALRKIGLLQ